MRAEVEALVRRVHAEERRALTRRVRARALVRLVQAVVMAQPGAAPEGVGSLRRGLLDGGPRLVEAHALLHRVRTLAMHADVLASTS